MQIEKFVRIRNMSIAVTAVCAAIILFCHNIDTDSNNVNAMRNYIIYSRQCVEDGESTTVNIPESCSMLLRNDTLFKSNPDLISTMKMSSVEDMEEFVSKWDYADTHKINPYINAYIKQSLWEYADWCIDKESDDYWHMKYVASQKTGGYSYARQIKYKWYKFGYENAPFIVMVSLFAFVFVNVLCVLYGFSGSRRKTTPVEKMPKWNNTDGEE